MIDLRGKWFEVEIYNRLMDKLIDLLIRLGLVEEDFGRFPDEA